VYVEGRTGSVLLRRARIVSAALGIHAADAGGPHTYEPPVTMVAPPRARALSEAPPACTTLPTASRVGSMGFSESTMSADGVSMMSFDRQRP